MMQNGTGLCAHSTPVTRVLFLFGVAGSTAVVRNIIPVIFILVTGAASPASAQVDDAASEERRKARIRELASQDKGEVTAMEPSADGAVIVGFSSGSVLSCAATAGCDEFDGTPSVPVTRIAISRDGASPVIWVAYRQGALYRCRDRRCEKLDR